MGIRMFLLAASPALCAALLTASCVTETLDGGRDCTLEEARVEGCVSCPYTCKLLDGGADAEGGVDAGEDADAGEGGTACEGECVPNTGVSWQGPVLLARGAEGKVPECPE